MASVFMAGSWHSGEQEMHRLTNVPEHDNPTAYGMTAQAAYMLQAAPLLALGTLDSEGRPWTTLLGGEPGFSRPLGGPIVGVSANVDAKFDPVIEALVPKERRMEQVVRYDGEGKMIAGLTIDMMTRKRVKIAGRMVAGAVAINDEGEEMAGLGDLQMGIKVEQSLGNCPKYLNKKQIRVFPARPRLISDSPKLTMEALKLLAKADLFFISSTQANKDMDTNHRGGPAGFVRVISNTGEGAEIIYPEYSGNRLYQTLGNLRVTPLAGLVVPNFETGDVLYLTGETEVLIGEGAAKFLPHSNLAVKIRIKAARYVAEGLPFRGIPDEMSPYNPNVRLLASESALAQSLSQSSNTARLVERTTITPTISRYRFSLTNPTSFKAGQWVALDFSDDLDMGYSHMRDDDPRSLNDDFVRTFTVSSPPSPGKPDQHEFEVTLRLHGPVTRHLSRVNLKRGVEIPVRGFGGEFMIKMGKNGITHFVAGGVGITPLLGQLDGLDLNRLRFFWIIQFEDVEFVLNVFRKHPELAKHATVFFTGNVHNKSLEDVRHTGASINIRRPRKEDFEKIEADTWYACAGNSLRGKLLEWLEGRRVLYENFDY